MPCGRRAAGGRAARPPDARPARTPIVLGRLLIAFVAIALAALGEIDGLGLRTPLSAAPAFAAPGPAAPLTLVQQQRYVMGTMIDIIVYHPSREEAAQAIERAMQEIVRLDRVLSHYKEDSDLSRLIREGRQAFVTVDASLFDVIEQSLHYSRLSGGRFDITIAPLLRAWREAYASGRAPTEEAIAEAKRCVGYEKIEIARPNRIKLRSDCMSIDLGGIGKGYAVDRALAVLKAAGIRRALINAGGSSLAALGTPPGREGWPVRLAGRVQGHDVLLLRDTSMSTSQQQVIPLMSTISTFGEILDPKTGEPPASPTAVTIVMENGTAADALSTALVLLPIATAPKLLDQFPDVAALWIAVNGELRASYGEARLQFERLAATPE